MSSSKMTNGSIAIFSEQTDKLKNELGSADAILIGAGAGLSSAAGIAYSGERFEKYFSDFRRKYGITDMYTGGFYPYGTKEEFWACWSRHILFNRYEAPVGILYSQLLELVREKDYFVLTTNVDHQFQKAGFDKSRLFYTQGDYGLFQCTKNCLNKTFDNEAQVREMVKEQNDMKIPTELIPRCPLCGEPLTVNLRWNDDFVQDEGWYAAYERYNSFVSRHSSGHVLYLELGVGFNTPVIIKYPFWRMTAQNPNAVYVTVNSEEAYCPEDIKTQSVCIGTDIGKAIASLR